MAILLSFPQLGLQAYVAFNYRLFEAINVLSLIFSATLLGALCTSCYIEKTERKANSRLLVMAIACFMFCVGQVFIKFPA